VAHKPFEIVPILAAATIGGFVLLTLVALFDTSNTKLSNYWFFGFLTGIGVQVGVRLAGVS
jgi:hypothetical protein